MGEKREREGEKEGESDVSQSSEGERMIERRRKRQRRSAAGGRAAKAGERAEYEPLKPTAEALSERGRSVESQEKQATRPTSKEK